MTGPYSADQLRQVYAKYQNAPGDFGDRPTPTAPPFDDVPPPAHNFNAPPQQVPYQGQPPSPQRQWEPPMPPLPPQNFSGHEYGARTATHDDIGDSNRSARIGVRTEGPQQGWRMHANKFGFRFGKSDDEIKYDGRITQIRRTLRTPKTIAVISGKGSAGKTSTSLNLGATLATHQRGLKVVAASIDPLGNIADRTKGTNDQRPRSVMSLASDEGLNRDSDVSSYLLTEASGLRVLGSSTTDNSSFLTAGKLETAHGVLREFFNVILLDFGLNIDSEAYHKGLALADQLVLVASTSADSIDELHTLIQTLKQFGGKYIQLVHDAVVVFTQTDTANKYIDVSAERARIVNTYGLPVVTIPWDEHISEGGPMSFSLLNKHTKLPFVWLAAEVMSKMPD